MSGGRVDIVIRSSPGAEVTLDQLTTVLGFIVEVDPDASVTLSSWKLEISIPAAKFIEALGVVRRAPVPQAKVYQALDVECPKCRVPAGVWCVTLSGLPAANLHQKREEAVSA